MRLKEEQIVDTSEWKYTLVVGEGMYMGQSVWSLVTEIIKHRWFHWKRGDGWMD